MKKVILLFVLVLFVGSAYGQNSISGGYITNHINLGLFHSKSGVLFSTNNSESSKNYERCETLVKYPQNKTQTTYTVPANVYVIAKGAFQGNKYIECIKIPSSVKYIGDNAFDGCDQLKTIEIYESTSSARAVEIDDSHSEAREVGRYNVQGMKMQEDEDGRVQIILYSDGTARKVAK